MKNVDKPLVSKISLDETLERFSKQKSKAVTISDLQYEISNIKKDIVDLKKDLQDIQNLKIVFKKIIRIMKTTNLSILIKENLAII